MMTGPAMAPDLRLRGWKEIGRRLGVDERTAKRWEATRGLPVHRVPGEPRAPVYAHPAELSAWLSARGTAPATPDPAPALPPDPAPAKLPGQRRPALLMLMLFGLVALAMLGWRGWQIAGQRRDETLARIADVRQLARSQVAVLSDRLEKQPGTVQTRAALARDAAAMLARIAAMPDADPALARDAAEAWRRLALVQNNVDRPSLRDHAGARASLAAALRLIADDASRDGRWLRARIMAESARQAAADGALAQAPALLRAATQVAADAPPAVRDEVRLAQAEVANWRGDYAAAIRHAQPVRIGPIPDAASGLRQLRALDLIGEAQFYGGAPAVARATYQAGVAAARAGMARWPDEPRYRWALQRQQWNLGTTLLELREYAAALPALRASRDGWLAMARSDPADQSLASWVRTTRLSHGEALAGAGQRAAAIAELSVALAERRIWFVEQPDSQERRRALVVGLNALADVLAVDGRGTAACTLIAEAATMISRMAGAGTLAQLDRDSMVKLLQASATRHCRANGPAA